MRCSRACLGFDNHGFATVLTARDLSQVILPAARYTKVPSEKHELSNEIRCYLCQTRAAWSELVRSEKAMKV